MKRTTKQERAIARKFLRGEDIWRLVLDCQEARELAPISTKVIESILRKFIVVPEERKK